jgi:hypothetical protein
MIGLDKVNNVSNKEVSGVPLSAKRQEFLDRMVTIVENRFSAEDRLEDAQALVKGGRPELPAAARKPLSERSSGEQLQVLEHESHLRCQGYVKDARAENADANVAFHLARSEFAPFAAAESEAFMNSTTIQDEEMEFLNQQLRLKEASQPPRS